MAAMEVNFVTINRSCMIIATGWFGSKGFWFRAAHEVVQIEDVEVVQGFFTVPSSENVQLIAYFVTRVGSAARRRIILRNGCVPSH